MNSLNQTETAVFTFSITICDAGKSYHQNVFINVPKVGRKCIYKEMIR